MAMNYFKIITFGVVNYLIRFAIGGMLYLGAGINPVGLGYGTTLTAVALISSYLFLRFVIKPRSMAEAFEIAAIWVAIAFILDVVTAQPIVHVSILYMLGEWQFWTRLAIMVLVVPAVFTKSRP